MKKEEFAQFQLSRLYEVMSEGHERTSVIRNWCITVWLGSVALPMTEHVKFSMTQRTVIAILPVVLFWLLEGFHHCFNILHARRAGKLEIIIAQDNWGGYDPIEFAYCAGWARVTFKEKINAMVQSLFFRETVVLFYAMLLCGSVGFLLVV